MKAYTDYPFVFLGDEPYKEAPIREIDVIAWDGDKYACIVVDGQNTTMKVCYAYKTHGRCGEVKAIDYKKLEVWCLDKYLAWSN